MSLLVDAASTPPDADGHRPLAPGAEIAAARRGRTTVAVKVVETIAGRVAVDTPGVSAAQLTGVRGWLASGRPDTASTQIADDDDDGLHVSLDIAVRYPEPIAAVADEVRRRVTDHLETRCDFTVARVDVTVTELRPPPRTQVPVTRRVR